MRLSVTVSVNLNIADNYDILASEQDGDCQARSLHISAENAMGCPWQRIKDDRRF
jgi:hypothetical protein